MKATNTYQSWSTIQKLYPDSFVLLADPVFEREQILKGGVFLYKNKIKKRVFEKDLELNPKRATIMYTGGVRGDKANESPMIATIL